MGVRVRRVLLLGRGAAAEGPGSAADTVLSRALSARGIDCHRVEARGLDGGASGDWLDRARPDVVVADWHEPPVPAVFETARRRGVATVLFLRDGSLRRADPLTACDRVVVHSRFLADYYRDGLGICCDVLPPPVETGARPAGEAGRAYVTFLDPTPEAGAFAVARIADELGRRRPDIPLLVVEGRGTETDLAACGIDPRPAGNVHLMGRPTDPHDYWDVTRVMLAPSAAWDAPGVEAAEAVARGIPVVASDRGALPEVVGGAGAVLPLPGWLTPATRRAPSPDEVAPWVEAVVRLWDDPTRGAEGPARTQEPTGLGEEYVQFLGTVRPGTSVTRTISEARSRWVVLVPFLSSIEYDCESSLRRLEDAKVRVVRCRGSSAIDMARNTLLSEALHQGCESILFIDADIGFAPEDALHLLAHPEPVVAGVYPKKGLRELACAFAAGVDAVTFGPEAPGLYPLDYAAAGFLRVRAGALRAMIDALKLPLCNRNSRGGIWPFFLPMIVAGDEPIYLGEDWAFSRRLRETGVMPMADTSLRLFHIGAHGYSWEEAGEATTRHRGYTVRLANSDPAGGPGSPPTGAR